MRSKRNNTDLILFVFVYILFLQCMIFKSKSQAASRLFITDTTNNWNNNVTYNVGNCAQNILYFVNCKADIYPRDNIAL